MIYVDRTKAPFSAYVFLKGNYETDGFGHSQNRREFSLAETNALTSQLF